MTPSLLYCAVCGAANAPDHDVCFACQRPLALHEDEQTSLLHHRYQVLSQVGVGGFGAVYKALDTQASGRLVAIKQINLRGLTSQEVIEATDGFNREVQMLSTLSHAHLPRIHGHFTDAEHWYVVMDFIEGETLEHYLRDITSAKESAIRALGLDEVLEVGVQLCSVLSYLHTRLPPIIFRDLKPSNIMRSPRGQIYLIDFGTARYFKPGQVRDTIPLGSPGYAAPEQYGRAQTTPRADIYSLGALLYHLISQQDPADNPFSFAPLRVYGPVGLSEMETLITRMVELDVEKRPAGIGEVEVELRRIREVRAAAEPRIWRPIVGQSPPPVLAPGAYQPAQVQQQVLRKAAPKKTSRRKFIVGGLALTGAVTLGGVAYWRHWHPSQLTLEAGFPRRPQLAESAVSTIAWSADGQNVVFGLSDGSIVGNQVSSINTIHNFTMISSFVYITNPKATVDAPASPIKLLAWSPDNTQLLAVSQAGELLILAISQGVQLQSYGAQAKLDLSLPTSAGNIKAVAWSPNKQFIAVVDDQAGLYVYDALNGAPSSNNNGWSGSNVLAWSPDGTRVVTELSASPPDSSSTLVVWDVGTGQRVRLIPSGSAATALDWSPDGQYLAALSIDGTVQVWDSQNRYAPVFSHQIATQQRLLVWSPDSRFLTTIDDANNLLLLDRSNGDTLASVPLVDRLGGVFVGKALSWLPDGKHIVVANNTMECWVWTLPWF